MTTNEIVDSLNWKLWGEDGLLNLHAAFIFKSATTWESISFYDANSGMEVVLWDSENNDREYIEDVDDYEPLEEYILKEFAKFTESIFKVNNHLNEKV